MFFVWPEKHFDDIFRKEVGEIFRQ
jgi:hypothetical protein